MGDTPLRVGNSAAGLADKCGGPSFQEGGLNIKVLQILYEHDRSCRTAEPELEMVSDQSNHQIMTTKLPLSQITHAAVYTASFCVVMGGLAVHI